jgi:hypothetical protein
MLRTRINGYLMHELCTSDIGQMRLKLDPVNWASIPSLEVADPQIRLDNTDWPWTELGLLGFRSRTDTTQRQGSKLEISLRCSLQIADGNGLPVAFSSRQCAG